MIPFDFERMFFGEEPGLFYLEIIVRTVIVYLYALILVRWVGSRSLSQLSIVEFLLVVALGSAVGDPLFYPEVPILHALLAITAVVVINKAIDRLMQKSRWAQRRLDGEAVEIVRDNCISVEMAASKNITVPELFEQLRLGGVRNIGEIEQAYVEPNGRVSFFWRKDPLPGLPIVPPLELRRSDIHAEAAPGFCCTRCGHLAEEPMADCRHCGAQTWIASERSDRCRGSS